MNVVISIVFAISSLALITSILMQSGKSAGLSGSVGGGAQQIFGKSEAKGLDKLFDKVTKIAAITFVICSILVYVV